MAEYLLELGLEEIPSRFIDDLSQQLAQLVSDYFKAQRLSFDSVSRYSTPRRLAVIVHGLAEKQTDHQELVKGPALRIAQDDQKQWTKAAEGFVRGQGATTDDIEIQSIKGEDYIFVNKFEAGVPAEEVIQNISQVFDKLVFPVSMTWGMEKKPFIRPLHWIVSLYGDQVIPIEYLYLTADRYTEGHRFLGERVFLSHPNAFLDTLREQYVMADVQERENTIREQIAKLANENHWIVPMDASLLEEVNNLIEWPTAFCGTFEPEFLELPPVVLTTTMKEHQRYFYVLDKATDELLPYFISVRNGNTDHLENVVHGNEKVLRARLDDALFFYREDMKHSVDYFMEKLSHIKEHYQLDTLAKKQERVIKIIEQLVQPLNLEVADVETALAAAKIYKFDLATLMVDELSELQGIIGGVYAEKFGIESSIAQAISEQYLPNQSGGALPKSIAGSVLALADKIDTLIQYFNVGIIPSGSSDPYGLRRQAIGMVEILVANQWSLNLDAMDRIIHAVDTSLTQSDLKKKFVEFIRARLEKHLQNLQVDYDIIDGVAHAHQLNPYRQIHFALKLQQLKQEQPELFQSMIEALSRVMNIASDKEESEISIQSDLSQSNSEEILIQKVSQLQSEDSIQQWVDLVKPIKDYFEENLVNHEDEAIRINRMNTMARLSKYIRQEMDPRLIIYKF